MARTETAPPLIAMQKNYKKVAKKKNAPKKSAKKKTTPKKVAKKKA